jgi:hypothetical protein
MNSVCSKCGGPTRAIDVTWCSEAVSAYGGWQYYCPKCDIYYTNKEGKE